MISGGCSQMTPSYHIMALVLHTNSANDCYGNTYRVNFTLRFSNDCRSWGGGGNEINWCFGGARKALLGLQLLFRKFKGLAIFRMKQILARAVGSCLGRNVLRVFM